MLDYSVLLEKPVSSKEFYHRFRNLTIGIFIFFILLFHFIYFIDPSLDPSFHITAPLFFFTMWLLFLFLSVANILSFTEDEVYNIYDIRHLINFHNMFSKLIAYIKLALFKDVGLWFYPLISALMLIAGAKYINLTNIPFTEISIQTIALVSIYFSLIYPLRYLFKRYKSVILTTIKQSSSNISLSCRFIQEEVDRQHIFNDPVNADLINVNIINILDNIKETSEIDRYFEEADNPPDILDFVRFSIPTILTIFISELVPLLKVIL